MEEREKDTGTVTISFRKSYLFAVFTLVVGFGAGFGVHAVMSDGTSAPPVVAQVSEQNVQAAQIPPPPPPSNAVVPQQASALQISVEGRPYLGPEEASVTIVEFTDYQCPFCSRHFRETFGQLIQEYEGRVKYVVRNYPIATIHPFAQKAAEAAECAYDQDKFWEYHDLLFENQQSLDTESLKAYAAELDLETGSFDTCLDSDAKAQLVLQDFQDGQSYGVTGTPTFFINGQRLVGAQPFASFKTVIDAAINR